jgi:hypothetical protein
MSQHAPRGPIKSRDHIQGADPIQKKHLAGDAPRCTARTKHTKRPCANPAIKGGTVCRMHGGSAPQVKQAAMERLRALQHPALDALDWLLKQRDFPSAAMSAAKDVLDRTEGKPAETVAMAHSGKVVIEHEGL